MFGNAPVLERIITEIKQSHRYLALLSMRSTDNRFISGMQLLTVQTMLLFLLAVLYDLQAPDDDGSCQQFLTEASCLKRRSALDATKTYCQWAATSTADTAAGQCAYRQVTLYTLTVDRAS